MSLVIMDWYASIFSMGSILGLPVVYLPVTVALFVANNEVGIRLFISMMLIEFAGAGIKLLFPTVRPVPLPRQSFKQKIDAGSFPSTHSARIAALGFTLVRLYPNAVSVVLSIAAVALVGYSRVYLRKHYTIDVIAGVAGGIIINLTV